MSSEEFINHTLTAMALLPSVARARVIAARILLAGIFGPVALKIFVVDIVTPVIWVCSVEVADNAFTIRRNSHVLINPNPLTRFI